jgi:hypothetical protein
MAASGIQFLHLESIFDDLEEIVNAWDHFLQAASTQLGGCYNGIVFAELNGERLAPRIGATMAVY